MVDVGAIAYSTLTNSSALISALGDTSHISASYPSEITIFPYVIFLDDQRDNEFGDNLPMSSDANITIHVFVKDDSPYAITKIICDLFKPLYWSCVSNVDSPDPDNDIRHRVLSFTRKIWDV